MTIKSFEDRLEAKKAAAKAYIAERREEIKNTWIASDGGLTMAGSDFLTFLKNTEKAIIKGRFRVWAGLGLSDDEWWEQLNDGESWEQSIIDHLVHEVFGTDKYNV